MRAVVQRVSSARVTVGDRIVGEIGCGLLVFVGVEEADDGSDVAYMAAKVSDLRVFDDAAEGIRSRMNRSVRDIGGSILLVSQFTLHGDCRRGRRPSFDRAAKPELARALYDQLTLELRRSGVPVETGEFQAMMCVELVNDGPVTLLLDSKKAF